MLNETMPGGEENVLQKLLELTAQASKCQAIAEERAAVQQETKSQEIVTTERLTTATATAQKFAQELLTSHTQNINRRTNNLNNATHVSLEAEDESPGNSGSHRQRLNNNQQQIGQPALHGQALSRSNSRQPQCSAMATAASAWRS